MLDLTGTDKLSFNEVVKTIKIHARIQEFSSGVGGGGSRSTISQKSSDNVFFLYFTEVKWLISKKISFFKVSEGVQHFPGGSTFSRGGPLAYSL